MKYSQQIQEENLSKIRRLMILVPGASVRKLQFLLMRQYEEKFDRDYINKLRNKVIKQRKYVLDRETVRDSMADLKDLRDEVVRQMGEIMMWPGQNRTEKIRASSILISTQVKYVEKIMDIENIKLDVEKFKYINAFEASGSLGLVMDFLRLQFGGKIEMVFNNNVLIILEKEKIQTENKGHEQSSPRINKN